MTPTEAEKEFEKWIEKIWPFKTTERMAYLEAHSRQQEKIDRLREGIEAALSYTLPYLAEQTLKKLLEEGKDGREGVGRT